MIRTPAALVLPLLAMLAACSHPKSSGGGEDLEVRTFDYEVQLEVDVPRGARVLRAWFARPEDGDAQELESFELAATPPTRLVEDAWGQEFLHCEVREPAPGPLRFRLQARGTRLAVRAEVPEGGVRRHEATELAALSRELRHGRDAVASPEIRAWAKKLTEGVADPLERARRLYRGVLEHVRLVEEEGKGQGSGRGSSTFAFDHGAGDAFDLQALFVAAARSLQLPTREVFGITFPATLDGVPMEAVVTPWVEIHLPEIGWWPIDLVEGAAHDARAPDDGAVPGLSRHLGHGFGGANDDRVARAFGGLDARRLVLHRRRDLVLRDPRQSGPPIRWLGLAHIEIDGVPYPVRATQTFHERGVR